MDAFVATTSMGRVRWVSLSVGVHGGGVWLTFFRPENQQSSVTSDAEENVSAPLELPPTATTRERLTLSFPPFCGRTNQDGIDDTGPTGSAANRRR